MIIDRYDAPISICGIFPSRASWCAALLVALCALLVPRASAAQFGAVQDLPDPGQPDYFEIVAGSAAFSDDFDRVSLGPDWSVDGLNVSVASNQMTSNSGALYQSVQTRWAAGVTDTIDQYGKMQVVNPQSHSWGFMFRVSGSPGQHYEVHLPIGTPEWRWEYYNPSFINRVGDCVGDAGVSAGDWIGATVEGTGSGTVVKVWRWDDDPDAGSSPDLYGSWGVPACVMTQDPATAVDTGLTVGVRAFTGNSTAASSVDNWFAGDVPPPPVCGNGVIEGNEECDDSGESAACDADCTFATCGDGTLNATAGEICDTDTDCGLTEICAPGCGSCIPAPVCGDGSVGVGEECDDGGTIPGDGCDENCIDEICGNGVLQSGEECDDGNTLPGDGCDGLCVIEPPPPTQDFSDDFDRVSLGPNWTVDGLSFSISSNRLASISGALYQSAQIRWTGGMTNTVDQYSKLQVTDPQTHSWGFMLRVNGSPGQHYEVHLPVGTSEWRWEYSNPSFINRVGDCVGDAPIAGGNWIGATIEGTGSGTVVKVWRWDDDPDAGGAPNIGGSWGVPDCVMTQDPATAVDTGRTVGVRAFTGGSTAAASVDNWFGGDVPPPSVCGDGVVEGNEECDDSGESASCDADCTFATCGDGTLNATAGEICDTDTDCGLAEICAPGCGSCIPAPVCGDGSVGVGEECDDGGTIPGDGCDENCIDEICGNGVLQSGEECDDGNTLPGDGCDGLCVIEPPPPTQDFSDDFDRVSLGPNWTVDSLSFSISSNRLASISGALYQSAQIRWTGGMTNAIDQYSKLQVTDSQTHSWGFMLRVNGSPGQHYEVHLPVGTSEWRWEYSNPSFINRVGDCVGDAPIAGGNWIGATIEGTGSGTVVKVWRWDDDPDAGGAPNIGGSWGVPDCVMTQDPATAVDTGRTVGVRAFTGGSTAAASVDNWFGGDVPPPSVCGDGVVEGNEECDDSGESLACDADCTFATCGDGTLNATAGEICDTDTDCGLAEICAPGCGSCIPAPVCGDGSVDVGEECDDGGTLPGDGCDENCINEVCGNGVLQSGEECDDGNTLPGDGCDGLCVIEPPPPGQEFSDDFNRATIGPDWAVDDLSVTLAANELVSNSGTLFQTVRARWVGGSTSTVSQYGKLQVTDQQTQTWGFMFRVNGTPGDHYEVHLPSGSSTWSWERYDPSYAERPGTCNGDASLANGDWIGASIEGTGDQTVVRVWRWDTDPDLGGSPDIAAAWGPPDCVMAQNPLVALDTGTTIGLRAYTGGSAASSRADNWFGGDCGIGTPQGTCGSGGGTGGAQITEIIDIFGAGVPNSMIDPDGVAVDSAGNVFVTACVTDNVFKIEPGGTITEIIDFTGDGQGNLLACPVGIVADPAGNVYFSGYESHNAFKVTPGGTITEIIDITGDGGGNFLQQTLGLALDVAGNVYVTGNLTDNAFKITPGGTVTQIVDSTGDGTNPLDAPFGIAVDDLGNVFVAGFGSSNAFKVEPGGAVTQIIGPSGDGAGNLLGNAHGITVDGAGDVIVTGNSSDNVFRITPGGTITEIIDISGDGVGHALDNPTGVAVNGLGKVYVAAFNSQNAFEITPGGTITEIIDSSGDGQNGFIWPSDFCVETDDAGSVYLVGTASDNVYRVDLTCGNGAVDSGELCDDAGESGVCDDDCSGVVCGDGNVNLTAGEQCEDDGDCSGGQVCMGCACQGLSAEPESLSRAATSLEVLALDESGDRP